MHVLAGSTKVRPAVWVQASIGWPAGSGRVSPVPAALSEGLPAAMLGIWHPGPFLPRQELVRPQGGVCGLGLSCEGCAYRHRATRYSPRPHPAQPWCPQTGRQMREVLGSLWLAAMPWPVSV